MSHMKLWGMVLCLLSAARVCRGEVRIDADFPGGNIIVERVEGDSVRLGQDLRDTEGDWFYWHFRVRGAEGRTLRFTFTGSDVVGVAGPAVSTDGGQSFTWLGREKVQGKSFTYTFSNTAADVRFCMGIPYLESTLKEFLARHAGRPELRLQPLCRSRKGRTVELLRLGRLDGQAPYRVVFTCRHHACEMAASYELEGIIEHALGDEPTGRWLRENAEFFIVPFVDKDGVEDGDQGKNRRPHDHNRDYLGQSIYPEIAAIRQQIPPWCAGRPLIAIDLHCPTLRGGTNERVHFVGGPEPENWQRVLRLCQTLQETQKGELIYRMQDNVPHGQSWNTLTVPSAFGQWAATLAEARIATTIEFPYAKVGDRLVTPQTARVFGHDVARAVSVYMQTAMPKIVAP